MGCAQKPEYQIFDPKGLERGNKLKKIYFLLYLSSTSSSPSEVHLQFLERFQRFKEKIQIIQEEGLHLS